jgi:DNA topoisomerase-3
VKVVLAEKPSVARDIAKELRATSRKDGYLEGNGYIVTWAFGHLIGLKEPDGYDPGYKRWSLDVLPIIPEKFELMPTGDEGARKQLNTIKKLFKRADEIICATDAGREGELIFRYIQIWSQSTRVPFKRLWISSLTSQAIRNGFAHLTDGHAYDHLFHAARCRSEADWIVGMNCTRFFTLQFGGNNSLWSIGRVQTPLLALIVNRDHEIEHFKPEDYWEVHSRYRETLFKHQNGKFKQKAKADAVLQKVTGQDLVIEDVQGREEKIPPPLLHDLTDLQKEMNRRFGMTATRALKAAQNLYERKHLTYPRTDSRYLSSDMKPGIPKLLAKLKAVRAIEIDRLDLRNLAFTKRLVNDANVSDHHAIIPTEIVPGAGGLNGDEGKVYEAVVTRFIAAFYPPCRKRVTTVLANSNAEPFKATGRVLIDEGWQALYPHMNRKQPQKPGSRNAQSSATAAENQQQMPAFQKGERGPHEPELKALQTKPPQRFNEATLLQAMETAGRMVEEAELKAALAEKGLGTAATRAQIIETLLSRKYIVREKRNLVSTTNGRHLIALVHDERLKSPELTGEWEANLKKMERGAFSPERFMQDVIIHVRGIILRPDADTGDAAGLVANGGFGPCPLCAAPVIKGREYYGCSGWKNGCTFVLKCSGFSVDINAGMAAELLRNRASLTPHLLTVDGNPVFGKLHLQNDGTVTYELVDSKSAASGMGGSEAALGICPACAGSISETKKGYGCSNWQNGCKFVIWKTIAGKKISKTNAKKLLTSGETAVLNGFKSKAGKPFSAKLKIEGNDVKFDFNPPGTANPD